MHGPHDARQLLPNEPKHHRPIPGVAMLLEKHQPGYLNPPKYLAFEEPPRGVRCSNGDATTSRRPPQLRRRQRRGAGSERAKEAVRTGRGSDDALEPAATEACSVPSVADFESN